MLNRVRRDVVLHELRARRLRMALCVLFLPSGYCLYKKDVKPAGFVPVKENDE